VLSNNNISTTGVLNASSSAANALVLSALGNYTNSAGVSALSAASSRWLVYSAAPSGNTRNGLLPTASEFGKTFALNAPATIGAGNRFVYATSTQPSLTYAVGNDTVVYGNSYSGTPPVSYASGLVGDDILANLSIAGSPSYTGTSYVAGNAVGSGTGTLTGNTGTLTYGSAGVALGYSGFTFTAGNLTITPRPVTVTADASQSKIYGNSDPVYTYTTTSLGSGIALTGALTRVAGEPVNTYNITQGTLTTANNSNYTITYVGDVFSITPRPVTVTANASQSKVYGNSDPASYTYTNSSLGSGIALSGALTRVAGEPVNTYNITQGTLTTANNSNYTITYVGDVFSITPRAVTVTANASQTKVYGNSDPALSYAITSGSVVNGDDFTGALSRTTGENIGSYALSAGTLSLGGNYTLSINTSGKTLAITPRAITVTANSGLKKQARQADPTLTYSVTNSSLVNGDAFTGALMRAAGENVGNYALNSGTLSLNGNYALTIDTTGKFFSIENTLVLPDTYLYSMQKASTMNDRAQPIDRTLADTLIMPSMWTVENPVQVTLDNSDAKPITLIAVTTLCINMPKSASAQCGAVTFKEVPNGGK
jgi:hypothetical protein